MISITILQDKRDSRFILVNDADGGTIGKGFSTMEEAEQAARVWASEVARSRRSSFSRVPQSAIDALLLSDDPLDKPYARLLASETWPAFETWLDSERTDTAERTTAVLEAIMRFAAVIISGMAHEHWPGGEKVYKNIQDLAAIRLKRMMEAE